MLLVWFGLGLLALYVPRLSFYWLQLGTPLSPAQKLLVALSQFVRYTWWLFLPELLAGTALVFWWCLHTIRKAHQARAM